MHLTKRASANTPKVFQAINMLVNDLEYACAYTLDDPLILSSSTLEDHLDKLDKDFQHM